VAAGRVVKGVQFKGLRDVGDPVELALAYDRGGADELVFLDIAATPENAGTMLDVVARVADVLTIPFTVGGGVRTIDDAAAIIEAGADRVGINSAALANPALLSAIADRFGSQAVVISIDALGDIVYSHGGRQATIRSTVPWAIEATERGAGEVLLTSIRHDGGRQGYDLDLTVKVRNAVRVPVIASGGAGTVEDVAAALRVTDAALVASIFHDDPGVVPEVRRQLRALGIDLRTLEGE